MLQNSPVAHVRGLYRTVLRLQHCACFLSKAKNASGFHNVRTLHAKHVPVRTLSYFCSDLPLCAITSREKKKKKKPNAKLSSAYTCLLCEQ